jgi:hypothetical protein
VRWLLTERYRERLAGRLSCYDRIIVTGTLPRACYAKGMTAFLSARQIRIFDYPQFAEPLRDRVRERAAELAAAAGVTIEHIAKSHIRKEDVIAKVLTERGDHPGLVHIISVMEACPTYKPWHSPADRSHLLAARDRQMPALLLLLHRRRIGPDLFSRPDLVSLPLAVLLQWASLAGAPTRRRRDRFHSCRQRLPAHRRLAARADPSQSPLARSAAPHR